MKSRFGFQPRSARFAASITIALVVACAFALAACGGSGGKVSPGTIVPPTEQDQSVDIAGILAAPVPDGVEPELWTMLKDELASSLEQLARSYDKLPCSGDTENLRVDYRFDGLVFYGPILWGDGSRNGTVDIADLSVIAINWGCEIDECEMYLDYDNNGRVGISDVSVLARNWGQRGDTYTVESSCSKEDQWDIEANVQYHDFRQTAVVRVTVLIDDHRERQINAPRAEYFVPLNARNKRRFYARVTRAHHDGETTSYETVTVAFSDPSVPPNRSVCDLASVPDRPDTVTWSTRMTMSDGNQNGISEYFDLEVLAQNLGLSFLDIPEVAVADYDFSGEVNVADVTPLAHDWGCCTERFAIEVSAESAESGFWIDGEVDYFEDCAGFTEYGFRYYEYQIQSPPESPYWVRVTPWFEDMSGAPGEAIEMGGEI